MASWSSCTLANLTARFYVQEGPPDQFFTVDSNDGDENVNREAEAEGDIEVLEIVCNDPNSSGTALN